MGSLSAIVIVIAHDRPMPKNRARKSAIERDTARVNASEQAVGVEWTSMGERCDRWGARC